MVSFFCAKVSLDSYNLSSLIIDGKRSKLSSRRRSVVVISAAQLHSSKLELRFCAGSDPAHGVSEIRDGEDL